MRATKDSGVEWLGDVPQIWETSPLRTLMSLRNERNTAYRSDNYLSLMANVGIIPYAEKGDVGNKAPEDLGKCKIVSEGDFVLNSMNFGIGSFGVSAYNGICSSVYVVMEPRLEKVVPSFLKYIFSMQPFQKHVQSLGNGILEHRAGIGWDELKNMGFPMPDLDEQRRIAVFLDRETAKIDALIAKQEQLVATLGERLQGEISKSVLQGLETDADLKDSGISWMGQIVSSWTVSRIGRHYDLTLGKMLNEQSQTEGVTLPYVRAGSIQENGLDFENIKTMSFSSSEVKNYQILPGDVLVVEGGSIGRSIYLPEGLPNWGFQNHVIRLRALRNQFPGFVDFYIKHLKAIGHFDRLSAFATIPNLSADKLSKIEMPVLPFSQQVAIFEHLSEETRLVKEFQRKADAAVELLHERRQAIISAAVTGKISVGA